MAQLTIYLPDEIESKARGAAKAAGQSVTRWVADQVIQKLRSTWSDSVLRAAGAVPDFPSVESIRAESIRTSRTPYADPV